MVTKRDTVVVRIPRSTHDRAMRLKEEGVKDDMTEYMDKASWLGYLIKKGIEKIEDRNRGKST